MAMNTQRVANLTAARPDAVSGHSTLSSAIKPGANCAQVVLPGASFTRMWYRGPERLMSQSERLPS